MSTPSKPTKLSSVTAMIRSAVTDGLAPQAADLLVANLDDTVLMGCVGAPVSALDASEATLVCVVLDMSGSMAPYRRAVVEAYNAMLRALQRCKAAASILLCAWAFDDTPRLVAGFQPVGWHRPMTEADYTPDNMTALYDTLLASMTSLVAYGQELADHGVLNRRVLFVLSDGADNRSRSRALDVRTAAKALLAQEAYTLAYAGFGSSDLSALADEVGFSSVVTTGASESELRAIFRQVSASVIRVSQATASPGGFF